MEGLTESLVALKFKALDSEVCDRMKKYIFNCFERL